MMCLVLLILLFFTSTLSCTEKKLPKNFFDDCEETTSNLDDFREDILVIGDSISKGYIPYLRKALSNYDISHNECNGFHTHNGVKNVNLWLSKRPTWKLTTFNHGLWDIMPKHTTPSEYRKNLVKISQALKKKSPLVVFISTTQVLPGTEKRLDVDVKEYNKIAYEVMREQEIPVIDLYSVSANVPHLHITPNDVHFTDEGHKILADTIVSEIKKLLDKDR